GTEGLACVAACPVDQVPGATGDICEHRFERVLEVTALGGRPGTRRAASGSRRLDGREPVVQLLEARRDLRPELVHRRVLAGGIEQEGELGGVALEIRP